MSENIIDKEILTNIIRASYKEIKYKENNYQTREKTVENIIKLIKEEVSKNAN